jgi:hypothetical protein
LLIDLGHTTLNIHRNILYAEKRLAGNSEGKRPLGRHEYRRVNNRATGDLERKGSELQTEVANVKTILKIWLA